MRVEALSELIGAIYDCVLNPANWEATLESINRELSFANSALGVVSLSAEAQTINIAVGFDPGWLDAAKMYTAESIALWGGVERTRQFPLDEPIVASQTHAYAGRSTNRYFLEVLQPRGILDAVLITLASEPMLMGYVAFNRHSSIGAINDTETDALRLLGPHFRRAVTISNLFDMKAIEISTFASTLDVFAFAVVLVDEHLAIVHANAIARGMLAARDPMRSDRGVLSLPSRDANAALERAVLKAASDETGLGPRGIGIPARRTEGEPCVIHVLPLRSGEARQRISQRAVAALFITPATAPRKMPADALALLYDLTPAETCVFELITAGMTQSSVGEHLGIARSTVKTHVLRLFHKTGCRRQIELNRLAAGMSSPA